MQCFQASFTFSVSGGPTILYDALVVFLDEEVFDNEPKPEEDATWRFD